MSRANSSTTPEKKQNHNETGLFPFFGKAHRFNHEAMGSHSQELGAAAAVLSQSYDVSRVIGTIASMVLKSRTAQDHGDAQLTPVQEFDLIAAIEMLSSGLNATLCTSATAFDDQLTKGGA